MNTRMIEVAVGVLVTLGIASLLMLAMRVSGLSDVYKGDNVYRVSAVFKNIGGLKIKSKVTIGGVRVGRVTGISLRLDGADYVPVVELSINKSVDKIPVDSSASILTAGLLGDNYVGIELGQDDEVLKDGDVITLTAQALLLEELISKFAVGGNSSDKANQNGDNNTSTTKDDIKKSEDANKQNNKSNDEKSTTDSINQENINQENINQGNIKTDQQAEIKTETKKENPSKDNSSKKIIKPEQDGANKTSVTPKEMWRENKQEGEGKNKLNVIEEHDDNDGASDNIIHLR